MQKHWDNPEHWKKVLSTDSPNESEKHLITILNQILPNEFSFVSAFVS